MSRNNLWKKCQNLFSSYIKQTICITKRLENQVDLKLWTQDMINAFYQYCITKCIMLHMLLNQTEQIIELTGRVNAVHEALDKFHIMTKIFKQKVIDVTYSKMPPKLSNTPKPASKQTNENQPIKSQEYFNIWFSYCKFDESICSRLKERLIGEGYLVSSNRTGDQKGTIQNCDLIIIYLSEEYAIKNANEIKDAKSSSKTILLIKPTKLACRGKNNWLHSMAIIQLSYELFDKNFIVELDENNFDREYDRLLIEILLYTKPGRAGQPIAKPRVVSSETLDNEIDVELPYFTNDRLVARTSHFTKNDKEEQKLTYKKYLKILMKSHRIPADEMKELMKSCESIIENVDNDEHRYYSCGDRHTDWLIEAKNRDADYTENERLLREGYRNEFVSCVKRWQQKKTNKIRLNIAPFTLTGDINDALFLIPIIDKEPWCNFDEVDTVENNMIRLNAHENDDRFNLKYYEPWFTLEESHDYFHELIDKDTPRRLRQSQEQHTTVDVPTDEQKGMITKMPQKRKKKSTSKSAGINANKNVEEYQDFITKFKSGQVAWDITEDRLMKLGETPYDKEHVKWLAHIKRSIANSRTKFWGKKALSSTSEQSWNYYRKKQLETIAEIDRSDGNNADLIRQRQIGCELKTKEEMDRLERLDDLSRTWRIPENFNQNFFRQKKKNIIEFQQLCAGSKIAKLTT
ncbi:unnamed protein product [Rotaria socialis]|nr:unnamed protein product [Rotaria socialis]